MKKKKDEDDDQSHPRCRMSIVTGDPSCFHAGCLHRGITLHLLMTSDRISVDLDGGFDIITQKIA